MLRLIMIWGALFGVYLLFAGQASEAELAAAGASAAAAAAYHGHARWCAHRRLRMVAPWVWLSGRIAVTLGRETALVGWGLVRAVAGRKLRGSSAVQPFQPGGPTPQAAGRRGLTVLAASIAPNTYVIRVQEGGLLVHRLVPHPPMEDRRWPV